MASALTLKCPVCGRDVHYLFDQAEGEVTILQHAGCYGMVLPWPFDTPPVDEFYAPPERETPMWCPYCGHVVELTKEDDSPVLTVPLHEGQTDPCEGSGALISPKEEPIPVEPGGETDPEDTAPVEPLDPPSGGGDPAGIDESVGSVLDAPAETPPPDADSAA